MVEHTGSSEAQAAANTYQLSLSVDPDGRDVIKESLAQVSAWLRAKKKWDAPLSGNVFQRQPGQQRDLLTLHRESASGQDFRMRLTEITNLGIWRTQLTVSTPIDSKPWIALQVGNSEGRWAAVPGLALNLLDSMVTRDGLAIVTSGARVVTPTNVEEFLEELTDLDRRGLSFVAATDEQFDFRRFVAQVDRWALQVRGLAQTAVLTPDATKIAAEALGSDHSVAPWTLRTYYPDVDPAIRADGFRHKWMTTERLSTQPDRVIQDSLGRIARRHAYLRAPLEGTKPSTELSGAWKTRHWWSP